MSDQSQGEGWWQASDSKWYPPESHPDARPAPPPPAPLAAAAAPAPVELEVKGVNGTVLFDGGFVTIRRKGMSARMTVGKGDKRIPLRSISAIQFKPAGMTTRGFIQFTIPGGSERRSRMGSQTIDAAKDENSVLFSKGQQAEFEGLRDAIEERLV